jgi:acyl-CoA synthetase (AMP-forming)/AMP-acid ligase II
VYEETIPRLLARRRDEDGELRALVDDGGTITFAQLDAATRALAARLVAAGVGKGDRVGLLMPNGIDWAVTALAAMRIGAVLVPLSTLLRPPELLAQLATAAVTHLITVRGYRDRSYLDDLEAAAPGLPATVGAGRRHPAAPHLRALWPDDELPSAAAPESVVAALGEVVRPADDMAIMFTSGSRGTPKGVVHTHRGALQATAAGLGARCVGRGERLYIPMPFFWMGGFGGGLLTVLVAGATLVSEATSEPGSTIELLVRERVTLFRGWPDQAARIAAHPAFVGADLSSLGPGSLPAVLPPSQRPAPGARANLFGMTESFGPYCGDRLDLDMPPDKHGSCGRPFAGVEVRISAEGEIQLRGPTLLRGICGRERSSVFTVDGWYPTGDLGRLDDDGYLWYSGRTDDMFKVKGATVYPTEVEAALRSIPEVTQAFVTNVAPASADGAPDRVGALVVSKADLPTLHAAARARLSAFKLPTLWLVTPDPTAVPTTPTGKPDKPRLQTLLRTRAAPPST